MPLLWKVTDIMGVFSHPILYQSTHALDTQVLGNLMPGPTYSLCDQCHAETELVAAKDLFQQLSVAAFASAATLLLQHSVTQISLLHRR